MCDVLASSVNPVQLTSLVKSSKWIEKNLSNSNLFSMDCTIVSYKLTIITTVLPYNMCAKHIHNIIKQGLDFNCSTAKKLAWTCQHDSLAYFMEKIILLLITYPWINTVGHSLWEQWIGNSVSMDRWQYCCQFFAAKHLKSNLW